MSGFNLGETGTKKLFPLWLRGGFPLSFLAKTEVDSIAWRTQAGAELDLLLVKGNYKIGFEFKCSENPKITKSTTIAIKDLNLSHLYIVYPGKISFPIHDNVTALSLIDASEKICFS